jgi:hypothetical protein
MALNSPWISSTCGCALRPPGPSSAGHHLAVLAAALAGVLVEQHLVEGRAEDLRLLAMS